jgi:tripeptide aminopeptidase
MKHIEQLAIEPRVQAALAAFRTRQAEHLALVTAVQQIPAPTFAEAERAAFVEQQMVALGLSDVSQDALHNVYGRWPGRYASTPVIVSAHLDTVFPAEVDLTIRENGRLLCGPGIGDNSTGVAGLLILAQALRENQLLPVRDIWFVANVGEEGLGDLCGMRAVVERFGPTASYVIVEGGLFGQLAHQAIGVRRYRITVNGPGGHSWGSFGAPSAIHILGRLISAIDSLRVPEQPRTTYNVGVIEGGSSVNTIAASASLLLDLRSEEAAGLAQLVAAVTDIVQAMARSVAARGVRIEMAQVGDRPSGKIPRDCPLVAATVAALQYVGCADVTFMNGSTDANIPLSQGITAVCLGLTESGNAHRLDEYIDPTRLPDGLSQLLLVVLHAAGLG